MATGLKNSSRTAGVAISMIAWGATLAIRAFNGDRLFKEHMEESRAIFAKRATADRLVFDTPIADYAKKELGRYSYTKGAWSLYVVRD